VAVSIYQGKTLIRRAWIDKPMGGHQTVVERSGL
jgi:hypothetical protein